MPDGNDWCEIGCGRGIRVMAASPTASLLDGSAAPGSPIATMSNRATARAAKINRLVYVRFMFSPLDLTMLMSIVSTLSQYCTFVGAASGDPPYLGGRISPSWGGSCQPVNSPNQLFSCASVEKGSHCPAAVTNTPHQTATPLVVRSTRIEMT